MIVILIPDSVSLESREDNERLAEAVNYMRRHDNVRFLHGIERLQVAPDGSQVHISGVLLPGEGKGKTHR